MNERLPSGRTLDVIKKAGPFSFDVSTKHLSPPSSENIPDLIKSGSREVWLYEAMELAQRYNPRIQPGVLVNSGVLEIAYGVSSLRDIAFVLEPVDKSKNFEVIFRVFICENRFETEVGIRVKGIEDGGRSFFISPARALYMDDAGKVIIEGEETFKEEYVSVSQVKRIEIEASGEASWSLIGQINKAISEPRLRKLRRKLEGIQI